MLFLLLACVVYQGGRTDAFAQVLAAVSIAVLAGHAVVTLGVARAAAFGAICCGITFSIENLGVATGFPFGRYAFRVGEGLAHVGAIPVIVGPLYFGIGYPAWIIACVLLDSDVAAPRDRPTLVAAPLVAAFTITQWDVVMDPASSTIGKAWIWFEGGGYFGVPLSNFLGWFLTTWLFFQSFALFAYARRDRLPAKAAGRKRLTVPILFYVAAALCHLPPMLDPDRVVADGAGRSWSSADIRESAAILALFTMLPTALLALIKLWAIRRSAPGDHHDPIRVTAPIARTPSP
ncbi:putative membrane protein [Methylobacterium sp. BE186]|uniref:carotenoid biosynthesis protein n=1 Tax=Methylobacterium sp. BE186 TaxID=2817715 RepID=UPI002863699F|nr:carotenoid biosynthesis protein [Methylobacterium sp. BE186]MDR7037187.1 putative membrane protein [Methylobacterium sp. BE186]